MGNQICCDESHQKPGEIQKLEEDIVQHVTIVEKNQRQEEVQPPIEEEQPLEQTFEPVFQHTAHKEKELELPHLWPPVRSVIESHHFFESQLAKTTPQRRRYGGDIYSGQLDEEGVKPNGLGRMYKEDGSHYVGYFSHGRAHGRGVFVFANGSFYNGEFNHNKAETSAGVDGRYNSDRLNYVGGFLNNTFHGLGVETGQNYKYEGLYGNGFRKEGRLTWRSADGEYDYKGTFNEKNQFHGKGVLSQPHGTYDGTFVEGLKHGQGYYRSKNGTKYRGTYANNERNGKGTVYNSDDSIAYDGEIKNGLPHGKGKVRNGQAYVQAVWVEGIDASLIQQA